MLILFGQNTEHGRDFVSRARVEHRERFPASFRQPQQAPAVPIVGEGEPQPQPTPKPAEITVKAYLLALFPQDALVLKHLKDIGANFDFVLRSPTSTDVFDLTPINSDYLMDLYELEIPKPR